jgi:hypothetical protein
MESTEVRRSARIYRLSVVMQIKRRKINQLGNNNGRWGRWGVERFKKEECCSRQATNNNLIELFNVYLKIIRIWFQRGRKEFFSSCCHEKYLLFFLMFLKRNSKILLFLATKRIYISLFYFKNLHLKFLQK